MQRIASLTLLPLVAASLCLTARASTWIVDDNGGPGVDFTSIQAAINASLPGDVLLVSPGLYGPFALDKPLAIVAQGSGVQVGGSSGVAALPANSTTSLVGLSFTLSGGIGLLLGPNAGAVLLDGTTHNAQISVGASADVRFRNLSSNGGLRCSNSRVEVTESTLVGVAGTDICTCCSWTPAASGGDALDVVSGEVHVSRSNLTGGAGGNGNCGDTGLCEAGDGGSGIRLRPGALLHVSGASEHMITGGAGGVACFGLGTNGSSGQGLWMELNSQARVSGATFGNIVNIGGQLAFASPNDPTLRTLDTPVPGGNLTLRVSAPVGSTVVLVLGRRPIVVPTPGLDEDVLTPTNRQFNLGTVGANGTVSMNFPVAPFWQKGFSFVFQGVVTLPDTSVQRTNSLPVVLR